MFAAGTFVGRLGADPEKRKTKDDKTFVTFSLACDTGKDETLWIDVVMFGARGKTLVEHAKKGSAIAITGRIRPKEFEAKDGTRVKSFGVTTEDFSFVSSGGKSDGDGGSSGGGGSSSSDGDDW